MNDDGGRGVCGSKEDSSTVDELCNLSQESVWAGLGQAIGEYRHRNVARKSQSREEETHSDRTMAVEDDIEAEMV